VLRLGGVKQKALLAVLLLDHGEVVSSDRLIDALWGEAPPADAQTALQAHVSRLRKLLEPDHGGEPALLVTRPPGYRLAMERVIPAAFRRVHRTRRTPFVAIVFTTLIAMLLIATGDLADLADTTVTLLLLAFIGVNAAVLAARRDRVEQDHFVVPTAVPVIGVLVCIGLLTQREGEIFLRSGALLLLGLLLWGVNLLVTRREERGNAADAGAA